MGRRFVGRAHDGNVTAAIEHRGDQAMSKSGTKETNSVLDNHLAAAQRGDLEGVLSDYSEDSVLFLPQGPARGKRACSRTASPT